MADLKIYKVNSMPASPKANAIYVEKIDSTSVKLWVTDQSGNKLSASFGGSQDLQGVTDNGDTTTNSITAPHFYKRRFNNLTQFIEKNQILRYATELPTFKPSRTYRD